MHTHTFHKSLHRITSIRSKFSCGRPALSRCLSPNQRYTSTAHRARGPSLTRGAIQESLPSSN